MLQLRAIEDAREIAAAQRDWMDLFATGAEENGRLNAPAWWHPDSGVWGIFAPEVRHGARRWRNRFGLRPEDFKANTLVEINPPERGRNTNRQGLFAKDHNGRRFVLHLGRMRPGSTYVGEQQSLALAPSTRRARVRFADGTVVEAHLVARLDGSTRTHHAEVAAFIRFCEQIRFRTSAPHSTVTAVDRARDWEARLFPEARGPIWTAARSEGMRTRPHADVFAVLSTLLERRGHILSNQRLLRFGPDLCVVGTRAVLFEIKSDRGAAAVEQGLGQLLLYEHLLPGPQEKVLVLPHGPDGELELALKHFKVRILRYSPGPPPHFTDSDIEAIFS